MTGDEWADGGIRERLGRIEELDGQHALGVQHHAPQLRGGVRTHAHVILLALRRGMESTDAGMQSPLLWLTMEAAAYWES